MEASQKIATYLKECNTMTQEKQKSVSTFISENVAIDIRKECTDTHTHCFYKNYVVKTASFNNHEC